MFPFSQSVNPALRSHLDSQLAFFNDLSQSVSGSFQSVCEANLKLCHTMLEETLSTGRRMLAPGNANDVLGSMASGVQPVAEHLRAYQRHVSHLAAGGQVDLARVTRHHGQETSRTAHALADEVSRVAVEEANSNARQKEEFLKNFRDPFQQEDTQGADGRTHAAANGRTASEAATGAREQPQARTEKTSSQGFAQAQPRPAQPASDRNPGKQS